VLDRLKALRGGGWLSSETKLSVAAIKDHEGALEEDVTENGNADTCAALESTEVGGAGNWSVRHQATWDNGSVVSNGNLEIGKGGFCWDGVTTLLRVVLCTFYLVVVGRNDSVWQQQQRGTGVGNTLNRGRVHGAVTNSIAVSSEAPETLRVVHRGVFDGASIP